MRPSVVAAKRRLQQGLDQLRARHEAGAGGGEVCRALAGLRDEVLLELLKSALDDLGESGPDGLSDHVALVALGGCGRAEVAPGSDVDLMILHVPAVADRVPPLADRMLRDVFDAGLMLGHSVRTVGQACRLAMTDPAVCTSLIEARLLAGSAELFARFEEQFARKVRQRTRPLLAEMLRARTEERIRYGETVFLLEPNVKRSRGTLRDLQLLRWIAFTRYQARGLEALAGRGLLTEDDLAGLRAAAEFLLWLRNDLHFDADRAQDVLSRAEQLRIAERRGYRPVAGMLPVEQFMRDYFRHTSAVSHAADRLSRQAQSREAASQWATTLFGQRVEGGVRVGPGGLFADRRALAMLRGNLTEIMRLVGLAASYDKPIAPSTWEVIRREAARLPDELPPAARARFVALLDHPARLGRILRNLHDIGLLERFVPEFAHARGLLQFNQYHKYTVDEHCLRTVEFACDQAFDHGPLGRVYRTIAAKHVLHLAALVHDLGKGYPENHYEIGRRIAESAADRLALKPHEAEQLHFLAAHHNLLNHMAFRRDTSDERLVVNFAVRVGSPELLKMLYVLTAADLAAVGPDVLDGWKIEVITELFHRAMQYLAGDSAATTIDRQFVARRSEARTVLGADAADAWFARQLDALPGGYLLQTQPEQVAADLRMLRGTPAGAAAAAGAYVPETQSVVYTVCTSEGVAPGIFHRLCGALAAHGLQIRSAQINTLADELVLDRFWVVDLDYAGHPPPDRIETVNRSLVDALTAADGAAAPRFRRTWRGDATPVTARHARSRVQIDNTTSDRYTIVDVFTHDRTGLLYDIARTLYELGLSVGRAKIGTHLDQVVDVFYVTDGEHRKITDPARLQVIHDRLLTLPAGDECTEPAAQPAERGPSSAR